MQPTKVLINRRLENPNSLLTGKDTGWLLDSGLGKSASFEDQMNGILEMLEPRIDVLKPICEKYYCEFSCGLCIYKGNGESTPWVHLTTRYNNLINELKIEFDVDIMVLLSKGA